MKSMKVFASLLLLASMAFAWKPTPSTPEERKRALEIINKLEQSPMNPALKGDREWVFQWVKSSDVDARVCSSILKPLSDQEPSAERNALMLQNILASARYGMEHPKSKDSVAMFRAATEGVIRAYQNLVKQDASKKNEFMEKLIAKQQSGQLDAYVKTSASECAKHPATVLEP